MFSLCYCALSQSEAIYPISSHGWFSVTFRRWRFGKWGGADKICIRRRKHGSWEVPAPAGAPGINHQPRCWRIGTLTQLPKSLTPPLWDSISKPRLDPPMTKSPAPSTCKRLSLFGFCTLFLFNLNPFPMCFLFLKFWMFWKLISWIWFVFVSNLRGATGGSVIFFPWRSAAHLRGYEYPLFQYSA